ncbi:ANTAR domain-containing protein [Streptomyces sp. NPDC018019]|uniref:ANTAR domain-containing protein n=1 Tax=Streptomyces sp. NPDC018019 TaxID=3365030 RepID=UPI0037912E8F
MSETGTNSAPSGGPPQSGVFCDPLNETAAPGRRLAEYCLHLPGVQASGLLLADGPRLRQVGFATGPAAARLERLQVVLAESPCPDVSRTGTLLADVQLTHPDSQARWPHFTPQAPVEGFTATTAVPLQYQGRLLGVLHLLHQHHRLEAASIGACQVLAETTAWALAREQELDRVREHNAQLQTALASRIIIEQAKGVLAERLHLPPHGLHPAARLRPRPPAKAHRGGAPGRLRARRSRSLPPARTGLLTRTRAHAPAGAVHRPGNTRPGASEKLTRGAKCPAGNYAGVCGGRPDDAPFPSPSFYGLAHAWVLVGCRSRVVDGEQVTGGPLDGASGLRIASVDEVRRARSAGAASPVSPCG